MSEDLSDSTESEKRGRIGVVLRSASAEGFASALAKELDSIGYPAPPHRAQQLSVDIGLGRPQVYKLLKGSSGTTLEVLSVLRSLGCSVDRLLDASLGNPHAPMTLVVDGQRVAVRVRPDNRVHPGCLILVPNGSVYSLSTLAPGQTMPDGAIAIESLQVLTLPRVALLDDDQATLDVMQRQLSIGFAVSTYSSAHALFADIRAIEDYSAIIVDWRLPDMAGEDVVVKLRKLTEAPIFILTGDATASASIALALDLPQVHHVSKPADPLILTKRLLQAIG